MSNTNGTGKQAELHIDGKVLPLDMFEGSEGERAVDIRKLRSETGAIAYDPGYGNTGSCRSSITYIDGAKGILRHRGYSIEDLAENSTFLEVSHLLIRGELPAKDEVATFEESVRRRSLLPEDMVQTLRHYPEGSHPMSILSAMVVSLSNFYREHAGKIDEEETRVTINRLMGKMPTIAAFSYRQSLGLPIVYPRADLSYSENFLNMMFDSPVNPYVLDPDVVRAIDQFFILHADHEQNCSTSSVRLVASAGARMYASIASGVCALWGPLHGGANQRVIEMLEGIQKEGLTVDQVVDRAINDKDFRLFGFGHRVYKTYDPRARIAKQAAERVMDKLGIQDPMLDIAIELEQKALSLDYFKERNLFPNVDFYTGIMLKALGLPSDIFTVLFAIGRLPGWIANWIELSHDPHNRIGRPRQIYTGANERPYPAN